MESIRQLNSFVSGRRQIGAEDVADDIIITTKGTKYTKENTTANSRRKTGVAEWFDSQFIVTFGDHVFFKVTTHTTPKSRPPSPAAG